MDDDNIVNLQEYKEELEVREIEEIKGDINQLIREINEMIDEMESPLGPLLWRDEYINSAPLLRKFMNMIEEGKRDD